MKRILTTEEIAAFSAYLEENITGGSMHIVLDDFNVEDRYVDLCIRWAHEKGDVEGERLARILREMSKTQRMKMATGGYWG